MFGIDAKSLEAASWFKRLQTTAIRHASSVQCVGMRLPIPFDRIYQPTKLIVRGQLDASPKAEKFAYENDYSRSLELARLTAERSVSINRFLAESDDAIIFAGPGWGKTTFLHHVFRSTVRNEEVLPVLVTLRRPEAVSDLQEFVNTASKIQKKQHKSRVLLLVDGYDELTLNQRRKVSETILNYQALAIGSFYLSCREYYQVLDIKAPEVRIDGFSTDEKYAFVKAFLQAFQSPLDAKEVVDDLEARGFSEFLSHPLLLTLACITKTSASTVQPRSALRLLDRALEVLCYRWDEHKGLHRECDTQLDGRDRLQILRKIAFAAKSPHLPKFRAETLAAQQINLQTFDKVDPHQALMEIAKFYGIFVPSDDGYEFVHRTIHDFLAAQYWVESGQFARVTQHEWTSRTAYAACLQLDATEILEGALKSPNGLPAVAEILSNAPNFDKKRIADAIAKYFSVPKRLLHYDASTSNRVTGALDTDFVRLADNRFLNFLVEHYSAARTPVKDIIVGYCLLELAMRRLKLDYQTYKAALTGYGLDRFTFNVVGINQIQLGFLKPPGFQAAL